MELNDILKDLKKVDLDRIKESDVRIFQSEKIAVEYYNDAVDNIISGNTDIAAIKLRKVLSLSPDFDEASLLLKKINAYENERNLGEKVYDNIRGGERSRGVGMGKKTLPQKLNMDPKFLIKLIMVLIAVGIAVVISIILFKLLDRPINKSTKTDEIDTTIYYSQQEVDTLNTRIEELEENLAQSEIETQEALSDSNADKAKIKQLESETKSVAVRLDLYMAAVYLNQGQYTQSADLIKNISESDFRGSEKELYNEIHVRATTGAADSVYTVGLNLYNQKDYEGAIENMEKIIFYNPNFSDMARCYYIMGRSQHELGRITKAIELYEHIALNYPSFDNVTGLLYYTARAYQANGGLEKATELYNELINKHPESTLVGASKDRLREIAQQQN